LVCLDRAAPAPNRIRIVLDLTTPTVELRHAEGTDGRGLEEAAIELAASLIQEAHRVDAEVGLVIPGLNHEATPIRQGVWHMHRLLSSLAELDLDAPRRGWRPRAHADRSASVVVRPDRTVPLDGLSAAVYLTGRQLPELVVRDEGEA